VGNEDLCVVGISGSRDKISFLLVCATSLFPWFVKLPRITLTGGV
jgi:hypothetical protein